MADPRKTSAYGGIGALRVTYKHDNTIVYDKTKVGGSAQVGLAVTLFGEADDVVSLVGNAEPVEGRLELVESDGFCVVQVAGYMELPGGTSATLTQGSKIMGDLGGESTTDEGYIQAISADAAGAVVGRGAIVNNDTTTAVTVRL
jgi:hypothetical protein